MADLSQYDPLFQAAGQEWNVDPTLLKAVAGQESGGNTQAVSPKGAQGLMQITPDTQKYLGITNPNDPAQSIYGAAKYLSEGLDEEGSPEGALLYYHGGPDWRNAYGPESRAYVPAVTARYVALQPPNQAQRPAQQSPAPPASTPTPQGPLILGDSLASKGGLGGSGVVGAQPKAVLDGINGMTPEQVNGRDVVLSSGASNNPAQASLVYEQIQALKAKGANSVTVVGVGDRPDFEGVNDQLAVASGRAGGRFVPLDTTQLGPDRVHPTASGYKTLLAAATPRTATDASPAPAPAQGQGNAMASNDLPSWLPPAPQASGSTSAAPAAPDDLPSWLPPAPTSSAASSSTQPESALDTVKRWLGVGSAPAQSSPLAEAITSPAAQAADRPAGEAPPTSDQVINALALAPNTTYGNVLPLARDETTGEVRLAMPNMLRAPLMGIVGGGGWSQSGNLTIDPTTGAVRLTPEAQAAGSLAATPLRFSGATPLQFVPPGALDRTAQLSPEFRANPLSPEARTAAAAPPGGPATATGVPPPAAPPTEPRFPGTGTTPPEPAGPPKTSGEAKQIASAYYDLADKTGGTLTPQFTNKFLDSAEAAAPQTEAGKAVTGDSAVTGLVSRLEALRDKPLSLQAAQEVDEGLSSLISREYGPTGLSKEGKQLLDVQSNFRDQIANAGPGDIAGGADGFDALVQARKAWSQARKMDDLERIQERASDTDNPATSIRTQVRTLLNNRNRVRGYDDDEIAALQDAADRGVIGSALHVFGSRLIPIAAGTAGAATGPLHAIGAAVGAHIATSALRSAATTLQANRLNRALGTVAGSVPPNPLNLTPPPP